MIRHGRMNSKYDTYVYVGITNKVLSLVEEANLKVYYNGVECEYKGEAYAQQMKIMQEKSEEKAMSFT